MKLFPKPWAARLLHASALLVGLGLFPASLHAQTNTHQTAGVAFGLRGDAVRDDLLVPLGFAGPGFQLQGFYRGWVGPGVLTAQADFGFARLFNRYGHNAATGTYGANVAWTFNVLYRETWHLEVGPTMVVENRTNYIYDWDDAHIYWLAAEWLGPAVRHVRRLTDTWRLEASGSVALVGFQSRPPSYRYNKQETSEDISYFFTRPMQSASFVMVNDLQVFRLDVALRRAAYSRFDVGRGWSFGLDFRMSRTGIPETNINLSLCAYVSRAWGWR
jgi:hypothetical protein